MSIAPTEYSSSTETDIKYIESLLNGIDTKAMNKKFVQLGQHRTNKIKFNTAETGSNATVTIRLTHEQQEVWINLINNVIQSDGADLADVKQKANDNFAAAFKDGNVVIEVKENGKRTAFASEQTANELRAGKLLLTKKDGTTKNYDSVKTMEHKDFDAIVSKFIQSIQVNADPTAVLSSDHIAAKHEENPVMSSSHISPTQVAVKTGSKAAVTVPVASSTPAKAKTKAKEALDTQERDIETARLKDDEKRKNEQKILREEQKIKEDEEKTQAKITDQETAEAKSVEKIVQTEKEEANTVDAIVDEEENSEGVT
ncbi:MAG: hypothetical protein LLF94_00275 [Chlamydiales bacterium]|nr:hypothetical protein [Chlamydiales bacterium]